MTVTSLPLRDDLGFRDPPEKVCKSRADENVWKQRLPMLTTVANMSQIYNEMGFRPQRSRLNVSLKFLMKKSAYSLSEGGILLFGAPWLLKI